MNKSTNTHPLETKRSWEGYVINIINSLTRRVARLEEDNKAMQNELIKLTDQDVIDSIKSTPSEAVLDELYHYQEVEHKNGNK